MTCLHSHRQILHAFAAIDKYSQLSSLPIFLFFFFSFFFTFFCIFSVNYSTIQKTHQESIFLIIYFHTRNVKHRCNLGFPSPWCIRWELLINMYHISSVYRWHYDYTCSSDNCPSHMGDFQLSTDAVDDMTLHQSTTLGKNENIIEKSIK